MYDINITQINIKEDAIEMKKNKHKEYVLLMQSYDDEQRVQSMIRNEILVVKGSINFDDLNL